MEKKDEKAKQLLAGGIPATAKPFELIGYRELRAHLAGQMSPTEPDEADAQPLRLKVGAARSVGRTNRWLAAAAALRLAQNRAKRPAAEVDARLDVTGHPDPRALAGHAESLTQHPDAAGSIIYFEGTLAQCAKRPGDAPGDGHFFPAVPAGIAIDV